MPTLQVESLHLVQRVSQLKPVESFDATPNPQELPPKVSEPSSANLLRCRFGGFGLEELVREDAFGLVYRGVSDDRKTQAAVRWIKPELVQDAAIRQSFLRDVRAAAVVRDERIAAVHQVDEQDGHLFLATEWLQGESLETRQKRGPISLDFALWVIREASAGLHVAHQKGLVHGAVRPSTLWLEAGSAGGDPPGGGVWQRVFHYGCLPSNSNCRVKILDFGLTHLERGWTDSNVEVGSEGAAYLAPEQISGKPLDARTDVYAVGALLHWMLTGRPPFDKPKARTVRSTVGEQSPRSILEINPKIPQPVIELIERMLRADPKGRPASADEVVQQIDAIRKHVIVPIGRSPRPRWRRWLMAAMMAATVAVATWTWLSRPQPSVEVPVLAPVSSAVSVLMPQQAIHAIGERVTVEFAVGAIHWGEDQVYLIPEGGPARRNGHAFRVAIPIHLIDGMRRRGHFWPDELQGATIRLHGVVEKEGSFRQILVGDLEQFDSIREVHDKTPRKNLPPARVSRAAGG